MFPRLMLLLLILGPVMLGPVMLGQVIAGPVAAEETVRDRFVYHLDDPSLEAGIHQSLTAVRSRLQGLLADSLDFRATLYVVNTERRFGELLGDGFPDWGAAAAIPEHDLMVVKSPRHFNVQRPLEELIAHEYAHLALGHRASGKAPRWFDEGLAMLVSKEWEIGNSATISLAVLSGDLIPLRQIELMNRFPESRARLAYAQSYLAVQYMYREYGVELVQAFLDSVKTGASLDRALVAATGSDLADFEKEYHVYLQERFNLITLAMNSNIFWIALVVLFVVGAVLTLRRRKKYYKQWEEEETYHSTDFDYGDPDHPEELDDDEPWRK